MQQDQARQLLSPYLPIWLRERIGAPELQPGLVRSGSATVLHADLNGFTRLTAAFTSMPDGAERLHEVLNRCYSALVETITAYNGDVAAIAGDALTAWWPDQIDFDLARRCGTAMLAAMEALPIVQTPAGNFRLQLRIGVSAGLVHAILVGLPSYGLYFVLTGPAVTAAAAAEQASVNDTVLLTAPPTTSAPVAETLPAPGPPLSWEHFLSPSFVERLRLGELIAEYRWTVPAFAAFDLPASPEALHGLVAQVQAVVMRWGGWLNEIELGDKGAVFVMLFGAPLSRGDEPSRGVGCCLELREQGLINRAGITLGWLFVGAVGCQQRRVYTAQGDDMNLAAHLMHLAAPGVILVSGRVRSAVQGRFAISEPMPTRVKGHGEEVPVAQVLATSTHTFGGADELIWRAGSTALPTTQGVVGRTAARAGMAAAAESATAGRRTLILLEGESGIGKSCLLAELLVRWAAEGRRSLSVECSSGGTTAALAVWRTVLLALCGIDAGVPPHIQRSAFAAALDPLPPLVRTAAPLLMGVLGLGGGRPGVGNAVFSTDERIRLMQLAATLITWRAGKAPLLIVIEDAHWADELSLELVYELLRAGPDRLCLALSHRPLDGTPPAPLARLRAHPGCLQITVGRLTATESLIMIREQLGVSAVDPDLGRLVERHTEGQPLFIKEYLRELHQRQLILIEEGTARLAGPVVGVQVSNTAQGIIQARVDRLDVATRLTLKVAAVLGKSFQLRLLMAVHPTCPDAATLRRQLSRLAELQIIELELDGPEQVYRFKHGITHEVAYESLLFGQRRQLHAAVVRHYETFHAVEIAAGTAPLAVYDVLIAHLGPAESWAARAHYCQIAARMAIRQFATATALRYLDQALAITLAPATRCDLLLLRVAVNERAGSYSDLAADLERLAALLDGHCNALHMGYIAYFELRLRLAGGVDASVIASIEALRRRLQRRAVRNVPGEYDRLELLRLACNETYGCVLSQLGAHGRARRLLRRTITRCRSLALTETILLTPLILEARCLDQLGRLALIAGCPGEALPYHDDALKLGRQADDWSIEARARAGRGWALLATGAASDAELEARASLATSNAINDRTGQAEALRLLAAIGAAQGDLVAAERDAHYAVTISARAGARALEAQIWSDIAGYFAAQGLLEAAVGAQQQAARARQ
jgi:class 3 adenylate cyclase